MDGQATHQLLPSSAQSNGRSACHQPPASSAAAPASLGRAGRTHSLSQQLAWSKASQRLTPVSQQQSSWGSEQEPDTQACLGAGSQPPATPELRPRPQSCILPHVNEATINQAQMSHEGSLKWATQEVDGPLSQHDRSRSDAGKPPAISPITEPSRMIREAGGSDGSNSQPSRAAELRSAPWTHPTFAKGTGTSGGGHLQFSRHSRGQSWARCNSAHGPVPLAPLSFCWQQGHLPDIYQNLSTSPSRLKAQAHRGGQGAKSCLAW